MATDGCVRFTNSDSAANRVLANPVSLKGAGTVELCVNACSDQQFPVAGVENGGASCCTCLKCLFDELSSTDHTSLFKFVITRMSNGPTKINRNAKILVWGHPMRPVVDSTLYSFT